MSFQIKHILNSDTTERSNIVFKAMSDELLLAEDTIFELSDALTKNTYVDVLGLNEESTIDLRYRVCGTNWHESTEDGRWAGYGRVSTILFKGLVESGHYKVEFNFEEFASRYVYENMKILLNNKLLKTRNRKNAFTSLIGKVFTNRKQQKLLKISSKFYKGKGYESEVSTIIFIFPRTERIDRKHVTALLKSIKFIKLS